MIRRTFINAFILWPLIEKLLRFFRRHVPQPANLAHGRYRGKCNIIANPVRIFPPSLIVSRQIYRTPAGGELYEVRPIVPESNPHTRPPNGDAFQ